MDSQAEAHAPTGAAAAQGGDHQCREFAVKIVQEPRLSASPGYDLASAVEIAHPHLVETLGVQFDRAGSRCFHVMHLYDCDLLTFLQHQPTKALPPPAALGIFAQVTSAVRHLHIQGISHGDIRPENVLLALEDRNRSQKAVLCDFGTMARHHASNQGDCQDQEGPSCTSLTPTPSPSTSTAQLPFSRDSARAFETDRRQLAALLVTMLTGERLSLEAARASRVVRELISPFGLLESITKTMPGVLSPHNQVTPT